MENLRVALTFLALMASCLLFAYLIAERPLSLSLVDEECKDAQEEYYRARDRTLGYQQLNPANEDQQTGEKHDHADVCAQNLMADAAERGLWLLGASLLAAIGAAVAAWKTLANMRDTARRQLRAYVRVVYDPRGRPFVWTVGATPEAALIVENVGATPGYRAVVQASMRVANHPLTDTLPPEHIDEHTSRVVLHPKDAMPYSASLDSPLTADQSDAILREDAVTRIYLYGRVDYIDAFGDARWTTYRYMSNMVDGQPTLMHCAEGNDAN